MLDLPDLPTRGAAELLERPLSFGAAADARARRAVNRGGYQPDDFGAMLAHDEAGGGGVVKLVNMHAYDDAGAAGRAAAGRDRGAHSAA